MHCMQKHYQFAPNVNLTEAWNTFRRVADGRLQDMLNKCKRDTKKKYGDSMIEYMEGAWGCSSPLRLLDLVIVLARSRRSLVQ